MNRRILLSLLIVLSLVVPSTSGISFARDRFEFSDRTEVTNDNSADIDTDVDVSGDTGNNEASGDEGGAGGDGGNANGNGEADANGADGADGGSGGSGGAIVTGAVRTEVTICNDVNDTQTSVGGSTNDTNDPSCPERRSAQRARINVVKNVINDNGGTLTSRDFMIAISGTGFATTTFQGSATGTLVVFAGGSFSIAEVDLRGYEQTISGNCSGSVSAGESITCTFTNNDRATTTPPATGGGGQTNPPTGGGQTNPPGGGSQTNPPPSGGGSSGGSNLMVCIPASRQVPPNEVATYTAIGGTAPYTWTFTGSPTISATGTQATTSYSQFFVSYPTVGTQTITLSSGSQVTNCTLQVVPGQVLGEVITPGLPSTGAGGEAAKNIALILLFGLLIPSTLFASADFMKKKGA